MTCSSPRLGDWPHALPLRALAAAGLSAAGLAATTQAHAQATVKDDGRWRSAVGAAFTASGGNSESTSLSVTADAVVATPEDKTSVYATALYGRSQGQKTADAMRAGTKHDWNLSPRAYVFGLLEGERDDLAQLSSRVTLGAGVGWKFSNTDELKFEVFGGAGFIAERYQVPRLVEGSDRSRYRYTTALLGEESVHKAGQSTTLRQRFVLYPNLVNEGEYRAQWDAGVSVAASERLNITTGLSVKYTTEPSAGLKRTDTLFTTGLNVKFE